MKILRNIIVAILIILIAAFVFLHIALDGMLTGPFYDKNDLIENYENKKEEITEVTRYFKSILPDGAIVHIEFENNRELAIFHVESKRPYVNNWNLNVNSSIADSLFQDLDWTEKDVKILKQKLDDADCISISSRNPTSIGWKRSGMGMFSYTVFDSMLTDKQMGDYDNGCTYIYYRDNIVLEYGGGAIGPQCFPKQEVNK